MKVAALGGGVGASKLLLGLARVVDPKWLTVIVNTGDNFELHGLSISPDLDIVTYTLAGIVEEKTGWGYRGDTFAALESLGKLGRETWFRLGDRDLATHIHRTALLRAGATLSEASENIRRALGVETTILPMSDQPVRTVIRTEGGKMYFQQYLVREGARPTLRRIEFEGVEAALPAPGVLSSLKEADWIVICPSNPLISIGPILAVPGIREALRARRDSVVAVSPIVGGKSLKGPSDRMLVQMGLEVSALGVAKLYQDVAAAFVIDTADAAHSKAVEALGMRAVVRDTVMRTDAEKAALAGEVVEMMAGTRVNEGVG